MRSDIHNIERHIQYATVLFAVLYIAGACGRRDDSRAKRSPPPKPIVVYSVGSQAAELVLADTRGTTRTIESLLGRVAILEFWSCRSPFIAESEKARRALIAQYATRGVQYLAVDSNPDEYPDEMKQYLGDHRSTYTVLVDREGVAARRFNARRTPLAVVLDRGGVVRYVGGVCGDDQWARGEVARLDWLEAALEAVLAGRAPERALRPASGEVIRLMPAE